MRIVCLQEKSEDQPSSSRPASLSANFAPRPVLPPAVKNMPGLSVVDEETTGPYRQLGNQAEALRPAKFAGVGAGPRKLVPQGKDYH